MKAAMLGPITPFDLEDISSRRAVDNGSLHAGPTTGALRVLHLSRSISRRSCGVGAIALALAEAQRQLGHGANNWSTDTDCELREAINHANTRLEHAQGFPRIGSERSAWSPAMMRAAAGRPGACFDVLHQHGVWSLCSRATSRWRKVQDRPTVIAPHGALDAWALKKSRIKKVVAAAIYEFRNLCAADCLHATSKDEIAAFRNYGLKNPIALIPNGIADDWLNDGRTNSGEFRSRFAIPPAKRLLLFLSRVTPKKGLPLLLDAWNQLRPVWNEWILVVAGPDEEGHTAQMMNLAESLRLGNSVQFIGPVYDQDRRNAFDEAELFVLPTHSEGNPMAVLEALGAGIPVVTTRAVPCDYVEVMGCGWRAEISATSIQNALRDALQCTTQQLRDMGNRGRRYVGTHFLWKTQAQRTIQLYRWLLGTGSRPDFVVMS